MNNTLNTYNFQSIIALNEHLITLNKLDDILDYLSNYLEKDFSINNFSIEIKNKIIYKNFEEDKIFENIHFLIKLNVKEELKITIFFYKNEEKNIKDSIDLIKTSFKIISQTIYNKYLEYKILEMDVKDSLTGLYNRQFIDEYLKRSLPLSQRENKKIAFLKVGIDHFKAVIDEFDYEIGDIVLKELAKSLENSVRESDIIARIESDEFLIVLNNITNENNAIIVAEKIINNFKNVKVIVNKETKQTLMKTICTGISIYPDDAKKIDEIFKFSDIALYEAKNKGRSQLFKFKKNSDDIELF